ncbi:hypothetical protein [Streptomyces boninensis]|uniref:hypothetical protein n=1 Tax=Streptomyces boninensis TaxID=2039455 RepID=UPI003B21769D
MYNSLTAELRCPRCGEQCTVDIQFAFGLLDFREYSLGSRVEWGTKGLRNPNGRPPNGTYADEGYAECQCCHKDYWVWIRVDADVIVSVEVDPTKPGHIP